MQHTVKRSALALACVVAALSLAACGTAEPETVGACTDPPAKPEAIGPLAERIGIVIPGTARPVHAASITGMDDSIAITLDMPEADWPPFWAALQTKASTAPPPFSAAQNAHLGPDSCGWSLGSGPIDLRSAI